MGADAWLFTKTHVAEALGLAVDICNTVVTGSQVWFQSPLNFFHLVFTFFSRSEAEQHCTLSLLTAPHVCLSQVTVFGQGRNTRTNKSVFLSTYRVWLHSNCSHISQADEQIGLQEILHTGRRLGIPYYHKHGPDAATVSSKGNERRKAASGSYPTFQLHSPTFCLPCFSSPSALFPSRIPHPGYSIAFICFVLDFFLIMMNLKGFVYLIQSSVYVTAAVQVAF